MASKYIVFGEISPVVFAPTLEHAAIATGIPSIPTSAGFFRVEEDGAIETYGCSVSLKLDSKKEDAELIDRLISCTK